MKNAGVASARCANCGGRVEPVPDGNGSVVDRCRNCGQTPAEVRARGLRAVAEDEARGTTQRPSTGLPCSVSGCPGVMVTGRCECCDRRKAWQAKYTPKRECVICGGEFSPARTGGRGRGGHRKYCPACSTATTQPQRSAALHAAKK